MSDYHQLVQIADNTQSIKENNLKIPEINVASLTGASNSTQTLVSGSLGDGVKRASWQNTSGGDVYITYLYFSFELLPTQDVHGNNFFDSDAISADSWLRWGKGTTSDTITTQFHKMDTTVETRHYGDSGIPRYLPSGSQIRHFRISIPVQLKLANNEYALCELSGDWDHKTFACAAGIQYLTPVT